VLLVHEQYGWIEQQHMFDVNGELIASMTGSRHRYYPQEQVVLPLHLEIKLTNPAITLVVDVADYQVNRLNGDPRQLWSMPQMPGYQALDMARPLPAAQPVGVPVPAPAGAYPSVPPPPGSSGAMQSQPGPYQQQGSFPPPGSPPTAYSAENSMAPRYRGYSTSR
jgi:hypothetical protein